MQKPIRRSLQGTPVKRKMNTLGTLGTPENLLIQRLGNAARASTGTLRLTVDIGDDAAVLAPEKGQELILTCDWFLEGTHFWRRKHPPDAVGWKCLSRALSDIAAMGGKPRCFLLSLAIPRNLTGRWLTEFLRGLRRAAARLRSARSRTCQATSSRAVALMPDPGAAVERAFRESAGRAVAIGRRRRASAGSPRRAAPPATCPRRARPRRADRHAAAASAPAPGPAPRPRCATARPGRRPASPRRSRPGTPAPA